MVSQATSKPKPKRTADEEIVDISAGKHGSIPLSPEATAKSVPMSKRYIVLDALRGLALMGICLANFPEFSLYTFQPEVMIRHMDTAFADRITHFFLSMLVDGKYYTIFSLLFGIGFSMILSNSAQKGINGNRLFFRRMVGLAVIGFLHLMLLWSGDILLLYAILGMLLPLFMKMSDRKMLAWGFGLLCFPILWDTLWYLIGLDPASFAYKKWWDTCVIYGITENNFGTWLADSENYLGIHQFLMQGAWERLWEFIYGSRYFKVLGLFILGAYLGRHKVYARVEELYPLLKKVATYCLLIGTPLSALYALVSLDIISCVKPIETLIYTGSVYPMAVGYCAIFIVIYHNHHTSRFWEGMSYNGRMALTNYVTQSVWGMFLFYGVGLGLGSTIGLWQTLIIAFAVFEIQCIFSYLWLKFFRFGPLEWIWRMFTYGKALHIRK